VLGRSRRRREPSLLCATAFWMGLDQISTSWALALERGGLGRMLLQILLFFSAMESTIYATIHDICFTTLDHFFSYIHFDTSGAWPCVPDISDADIFCQHQFPFSFASRPAAPPQPSRDYWISTAPWHQHPVDFGICSRGALSLGTYAPLIPPLHTLYRDDSQLDPYARAGIMRTFLAFDEQIRIKRLAKEQIAALCTGTR